MSTGTFNEADQVQIRWAANKRDGHASGGKILLLKMTWNGRWLSGSVSSYIKSDFFKSDQYIWESSLLHINATETNCPRRILSLCHAVQNSDLITKRNRFWNEYCCNFYRGFWCCPCSICLTVLLVHRHINLLFLAEITKCDRSFYATE